MSEGREEHPFFVVGPARSGTTMVRLMLNLHPRLAVPDESDFIPEILRPRANGSVRTPSEAMEDVISRRQIRSWGLDPEDLRRAFDRLPAPTVADAIALPFRAYAAAQGKARWGDKTPGYATSIDLLSAAFPTARFLLLVRDGREVADAARDAHWSDGQLATGASKWMHHTQQARAVGALLGPDRFREVRYDRLVRDTEAEVREVCAFLDEDYEPSMLDVAGAARAIGPRLPPHHANLLRPMTPGLRDWRSKWSADELRTVEALIGPALEELGFERALPPPSPRSEQLIRARVRVRRDAYRTRRWLGWKVSGAKARLRPS